MGLVVAVGAAGHQVGEGVVVRVPVDVVDLQRAAGEAQESVADAADAAGEQVPGERFEAQTFPLGRGTAAAGDGRVGAAPGLELGLVRLAARRGRVRRAAALDAGAYRLHWIPKSRLSRRNVSEPPAAT